VLAPTAPAGRDLPDDAGDRTSLRRLLQYAHRRSVSEPVSVLCFGRPGRRPRPMWQRKRQPFFPTVRRAPFCVSMTRCWGP